jgi:hypothetical protein
MSEQQQHEMVLGEIYPSGTEEWYCSLCERRFLIMGWHPDSKQVMLNNGDEMSHSNLEYNGLFEMDSPRENSDSDKDEARLDIWRSWLEKVDFESWWGDPTD